MKKINLRQWMKDVDDSTPLLSLNLPGTHDASACFIGFSHFSRCQDRTVYEQLNQGVRVLDLRVKPIGTNRLGMIHGLFDAKKCPGPLAPQLELGDVLMMCYNFLDRNPSETIVIQFKNDDGKQQKRCFELLYNNYIRKYPERWFLENRCPDVGEVRGKIVLIRRCKKGSRFDDIQAGIDFSAWAEQDALTPEPLTLNAGDGMSFVIQDRYKYGAKEKWCEVVEPFLDSMAPFCGEYVVNYLSTAGGLDGPEKNAEYINRQFLAYPLDVEKYYGVIYLDFPTVEVLRKIIETN